jgi:diguanylate cyclase (GGDEF)-like protein/PAS domain S-box-containing protein
MKDVSKRGSRAVRMLIAIDEPLAGRVAAMVRNDPGLVLEPDVVEPAHLLSVLDRGEYEVYLVDASILSPTTVPAESARASTLIAIHDGLAGSAAAARAAGAADSLGPDELVPHVLLRTIRHALELADTIAELRDTEARHALTLAAANDGLWEWELRDDQIRYSSRWKSLMGVGDEEMGSRPEDWFSRVHPDDLEGLRADLQAHIDGRTPTHQFEHRVRQRDGTFRWVFSRGLVRRDAWGRPLSLAGSLTDISRRKRVEAKLHQDSHHDELTGLASRRVLVERLDEAIRRARQDDAYLYGALFLNLDRFKVVNDSIGLESGDQILSELGARLRKCVSKKDLVCRYGGDEFAILLEAMLSRQDALSVADKIHESLRRPFDLDGQQVFTTASIGVAIGTPSYERAAEVIRDAGVATNRAKRHGKSRTAVFDATMRVEAVNVLRLQNSLRQAVDRQEFEVYYQPIVSMERRDLSGFEALVRWRHPRRGIVSPHEFIPLAEETGLIVPIGQFVLREACRQMSEWRRKLDGGEKLSVSVNLSGRQLSSPTLLDDIERILDDTGLTPAALKLELTESTLIDDPETASAMLQRLRERGIRLYIDDFGTGYSSLSYLHRFAIDGLKIDKSFVDMVGRPAREAAIVPSIVSLAHNLGMGVIAEGVETTEQAQALMELDCREAQGFLYSRPVTRERAAKLIADKRIL